MYDIGWKPTHILNNVSASIKTVIEPVGPEKAIGIISSAYLKDPTDPQWQSTPEYKDWLAWMKKYNSSGSLADVFNVYGYTVAQTMVAVLKQCGNDLTRENLMKQAASIHDLKLPMLLPGITVSTSATDFAPIKQLQLEKFDGKTWKLFGPVISGTSS
jgi:branched-chain amino acid transport system substrate-binding protein